MRFAAPFAASLLLVLASGCIVEERQGPPPAAAAPAAPPPATAAPAPAPTPAPVATAAPGPVVGAPTTANADPLPPNQPPVTEPPPPNATIISLAPNVAMGQPPGLHAGAPASYWVWRTADGWWHLRTTTQKGTPHRFWGKIAPEKGEFSEVKASRLEFNDRVKMSPNHVLFAFDTNGHLDGFDFRTQGLHCVKFYLHNTGNHMIFIGEKQVQPQHGYFSLCPV